VKAFKGTINLDIRDSRSDWQAFLADKAPKGAPNVLVGLYDDTGCAAWAPYGGRINMPTLQRIADPRRQTVGAQQALVSVVLSGRQSCATLRKSTSAGTRASSMTVMRPAASVCCRA